MPHCTRLHWLSGWVLVNGWIGVVRSQHLLVLSFDGCAPLLFYYTLYPRWIQCQNDCACETETVVQSLYVYIYILLAHIFQAISCAHKTISINKRIMIELVLSVRSHAFVLDSQSLQIPAAVILFFTHSHTSHTYFIHWVSWAVCTQCSRPGIQYNELCYCVNIAM